MNGWARHLCALAVAVAGAAAGYACGNSPGKPEAIPAGSLSRQARAPAEYIVTLAASAGAGAIVDVYGRFGIKGIEHLGSNVFLVTLIDDPGPAAMAKLRAENAQIRAVEPNRVVRTQ